ncbi:hypothetical protein [Cyanobium sp. ATX 6E8]|nr:hypothetical protein [Cyanobium sp. ATX 6E8]
MTSTYCILGLGYIGLPTAAVASGALSAQLTSAPSIVFLIAVPKPFSS